MLDVAPIDAIYSLSKQAISDFAGDLLPSHLKAQAIDLKIHWVSETGVEPIRLTSGIRILPTVSLERVAYNEHYLLSWRKKRTPMRPVHRSTSCSWVRTPLHTSPARWT